MSKQTDTKLERAARKFGEKCADAIEAVMSPVLAPVVIGFNHIDALMMNLVVSSEMDRQKTLNRAENYARFLNYKKRFAASSNEDERHCYHFLCNIESLPAPGKEDFIHNITEAFDSNFKGTVRHIGKSMRIVMKNKLLTFSKGVPLQIAAPPREQNSRSPAQKLQ